MFAPERRRRPVVREEFNAPLGPLWARTDTENKLAVAAGALSFAPKAVPAADDPRGTYTRRMLPSRGLCCEWSLTLTAFGGSAECLGFGLDTTNPVSLYCRPGFVVRNDGSLEVAPHSNLTVPKVPFTLALGVEYRFRVLYGATGTAYLASSDLGLTWQLLWLDTAAVDYTAPVWAGFSNVSASGSFGLLRVSKVAVPSPVLSDTFAARTSPGRADTSQPWLLLSGQSMPTIAGDMRIPAGGTTTLLFAPTGVADGIWEADLNFGSAPSTIKNAVLYVRYRDSSNAILVTFNRVAQTIIVQRRIAGVSTTIATLSAAGFADNTTYRMRVVCIGSSVWVYQDGAFKLSASEPAFQYVAMCGFLLTDNLAAPDIRLDNVVVWGTPRRPLLLDSFDRPDGTYFAPTPDVGAPYVMSTDVGMPAGALVSEIVAFGRGQLAPNAPLAAAAYLYGLSPLPLGSFLASVVVRWDSLTGNLGAQGMMIRRQDDQNYLAVYLNSINNSLVVRKRLAGTFTTIASGSFTEVAGVDALLSVLFTGNTVEVYVNGTRLVSTSYSDFQAPGMAGPFQGIFGLSAMREDDLRIYALTSPVAQHDTFTRADSATTLGSAETPGTVWTPIFGATWGISANQAYNVDTTLARAAALPFVVPNLDVQADITRQSGAAGLIARAASAGTDYLIAWFDGVNLSVQERVASGGVVTLDSVAYNWPVGIAHTIRLRILSGTILVYSDGALLRSVPFAGHAGAAEIYAGLYNSASNTNRFDNFKLLEVA